jgi:hypothetical protein
MLFAARIGQTVFLGLIIIGAETENPSLFFARAI